LACDYIFADDLLSLRDANDPREGLKPSIAFLTEKSGPDLNTPKKGRIAVILRNRLNENDLSAHLKKRAKNQTPSFYYRSWLRGAPRIQLSTGTFVREKRPIYCEINSHSKAAIEKTQNSPTHPSFERFLTSRELGDSGPRGLNQGSFSEI